MTLRVTIEIVPFGDEYKRRVIEVLNISNVGLGDTPVMCEYVVEHNSYKTYDDSTPRVFHDRSDGALVLAQKALERINS